MGIKQSIAYWCLHATSWAWDIDRICTLAKSLGVQSVELAPPDLWPKIRSYGLNIAIALNGMPDPVFAKGLNNPRHAEEVIATTKSMIDRCAEFQVPNVIAFTGYAENISLAEGAANTAKGIRELARYAAPHGINICLEQLNTRDDSNPMKGHPGYQGDDIDYCAQIILSADEPNAKLLFDIYHVAIMNGDIIRRLSQYRRLIGHIHTAGVPGRGELDDRQELCYPAIMRALLEDGYQGYVGQEFIPTRDPAQSFAEAVKLCDVTNP